MDILLPGWSTDNDVIAAAGSSVGWLPGKPDGGSAD
jgi:hypothetical protein